MDARLLTRTEAAKYLGISVSALNRLVSQGEKLGRLQAGGIVRYDLPTLRKWIDKQLRPHRAPSLKVAVSQ